MEYAATVWDPDSVAVTNKLERIKRNTPRIITGDFKQEKIDA